LLAARLVFALSLRGLDKFSVGAHFAEGILQGGERETAGSSAPADTTDKKNSPPKPQAAS
jgi:hypothetical protein